jgi:hypothetical protein
MQLPHFYSVLRGLGSNDNERGRALGIDDRTVRLWRAQVPRIIRILASNPDLVRALAKDAELLESVMQEP